MMDKRLRSNVVYLTLLQIGTYMVPLMILPYLARVLGPTGFGQIGFSTAFTMYFVLLVEWGFNLSSTQEISIHRSDKLRRSSIFWETIASRFFLTFLAAVILTVLMGAVPRLADMATLLWLGMLQVLATTLSTSFYYQGIERMAAMASINLGIRLVSVPLILLLVSKSDDVVLAFAIQTVFFLLASLVNFSLLLRSGELCWVLPSVAGTKCALGMGMPLFLSTAGTSLYNNTNAVILGFVATEAAVAYFVAGFTLVKAVVGLSGPFAQAVFPRVSHILAEDPGSAGGFIRRMVWIQFLVGGGLSVALWIFLPWGVTWFYGEAFRESIQVVAWLSPLPLLICMASALGMQTLLPLGHNRWYVGVLTLSGILNCLILLPLGNAWGAEGGAAAVMVTELAIMLGMLIGIKKLEPNMWRAIAQKP